MRILLHQEIRPISQVEIQKNKCIFHTRRRNRGVIERVTNVGILTLCGERSAQLTRNERVNAVACRISMDTTKDYCCFRCSTRTTTIEWRSTWSGEEEEEGVREISFEDCEEILESENDIDSNQSAMRDCSSH